MGVHSLNLISSRASCASPTHLFRENKAAAICMAIGTIFVVGGLIALFAGTRGHPLQAFKNFSTIGTSHQAALILSITATGLGSIPLLYSLGKFLCGKRKDTPQVVVLQAALDEPQATILSPPQSHSELAINEDNSLAKEEPPEEDPKSIEEKLSKIEHPQERINHFMKMFLLHPSPETSCVMKLIEDLIRFIDIPENLIYVTKGSVAEAKRLNREQLEKTCFLLIAAASNNDKLSEFLLFLLKDHPDKELGWKIFKLLLPNLVNLSFNDIENNEAKLDRPAEHLIKSFGKIAPFLDRKVVVRIFKEMNLNTKLQASGSFRLVIEIINNVPAAFITSIAAYIPYSYLAHKSSQEKIYKDNNPLAGEYINAVLRLFGGSRAIYLPVFLEQIPIPEKHLMTAFFSMDFYQLKAVAKMINIEKIKASGIQQGGNSLLLLEYAALDNGVAEYKFFIDREDLSTFFGGHHSDTFEEFCQNAKAMSPLEVRAWYGLNINILTLKEKQWDLLVNSLPPEKLLLIADFFLTPSDKTQLFARCDSQTCGMLAIKFADEPIAYWEFLVRSMKTQLKNDSQPYSKDLIRHGGKYSLMFKFLNALTEYAKDIDIHVDQNTDEYQSILTFLKSKLTTKIPPLTAEFLQYNMDIPFKDWDQMHKIIGRLTYILPKKKRDHVLTPNEISELRKISKIYNFLFMIKNLDTIRTHSLNEETTIIKFLRSLKELLSQDVS